MNPPSPEVRHPLLEEVYTAQAELLESSNRHVWQRALDEALQKLRENERDTQAYIEAAESCRRLGRPEEALGVLGDGVRCSAPNLELHRWYINTLEQCNRTGEAIAAAQEALRLFPGDLGMKVKEALLLPIVYHTAGDVERYRRRFAEGLCRLCGELNLDTPDARKRALAALGGHVNVRLAYQACDDRDLQARYGAWAHRIMAANFPQWAQPLRMPALSGGGEIRVGYVSARFRRMSATKYFLGWMRGHDRKRCEVFAYHVGRKTDSTTAEVRRASRHFREFPQALEEACQAIVADRLHILVFLDVGMDPVMTQLAALRLAPVQCVAWDQPVTSGLPTADYFLSSDLAEPPEAQEHYAEKLVRLPGMGVCFEKPVIPRVLLTKTRADFHLREDAVVYLCNQYVEKYLPGQDDMLARIASEIPPAQFVFLMRNGPVAEDFRKRLERAFSRAGLRAGDHCVLLPEQDRFSYWNLNLLGHAVLDPRGWSGGVSTFEAIACGVPVVTMPGRFMRGRQSAAILTQLGVTDTIAHDPAEYVKIAVRLGRDAEWRDGIVQRMMRSSAAIYSDARPAAALEEFFREAAREAR